jgi:exopolyphosphatase/guanosine-5'-triphosphate,3'-diphosphate pyrophosphatase
VSDADAVAAVDCGTNSTRLLVVAPHGEVRAREMRITRLGEGVDATRRLRAEALARTFDALREFRSLMDAAGVARVRLVATSAVRDAANGDAFLEPAASIIGAPAELLSGQEEGRLSFAGATADLPAAEGAVVVVDIGGGSTEIVTTARDDIVAVSLDIGCVRLTERFLRGDPPSAAEVASAVTAIDAELGRAARAIPGLGAGRARLVGLAGTVSTLAALELGLAGYDRDRIHHAVLRLERVERWCDVLGAESARERGRRPAIPSGREDVLFGGALVLRAVMARFRLDECIVSEADILDGLVLSMRRSDGEGPAVSG